MGLKEIYASVADGYDNRHREIIHFVEEQIILDRISALHPLGRVLSIGCGTGHDITMAHLGSKGFLGVDICPEMLAVARRNYPAYQFAQHDAREAAGLDADTVVGLFGILNYLGPEAVREIVLAVGARSFFLVCYAPPYFPDYLDGEAKHYGPDVLEGVFDGDFKVSIAGLSYPLLGRESLGFPTCYESQKLLTNTGTLTECKYWMVEGHEA